MSIKYCQSNNTFHLQARDTSYVFHVLPTGVVTHLYWGKKLKEFNPLHLFDYQDRAFSAVNVSANMSLDTIPLEYPSYGNTDMRNPAYHVQLQNGSTISELKYHSHKIFKGKPKLQGLPATYVEDDTEAETLELELRDAEIGLSVILSYTVYENFDAITRSARFVNSGLENLRILRASSMSLDFNDSEYDFLHLSGSWVRERFIERNPLRSGIQSIESRRGASGHQQNPFIALIRKKTDEDQGEVFGFSLVYSGNFIASAEVDQFRKTRVTMGINDFDFTWLLGVNEQFQTPEVVMVYSCNGIGHMSRTFHKLYRTRLCTGSFRDMCRPILINNWEATYFDISAEKIEKIAKSAKEVGIELFVLDDGWFGKRNDDKSSLGDWFANREKLPGGIEGLVKRVADIGLQFGLWFEPEMISPDSELYRAHPDWCLHVPDRERSLGRNQLILDLSRPEVCDAVYKMISGVLRSAPITYVKWDMNRNMSDVGSAKLQPERQRETAHRYMLGLYGILEKITREFSHVLFESCSGGGGRFDPGMLYYMPQTWTSDNSDAIERLKIQYGTSIVYPVSSMGAHVSAVPNHQVHRTTPLKTRGDVAMSGVLGYELDLNTFSKEEMEIVKQQVAFYKQKRQLLQFGDFYRILSPFEGNETAWMFVSEDKSEALVYYYKVLAEANSPFMRLRLKGLDAERKYELVGSNETYSGDELIYAGIRIPQSEGDFQSTFWNFKAI